MPITAVFFDIDGTLVDSRATILAALRDAVAAEGMQRSIEDLAFAFGLPGSVTLARLGIAEARHGEVMKRWMTAKQSHLATMRLFDGVVPAFEALRQSGMRLGAVTSKTRAECAVDLGLLGLTETFEVAVCLDDVRNGKPDPESLHKALALVGAAPEQAVFVGDTDHDRLCARDAGVRFIRADWNPEATCAATGAPFLATFADLRRSLILAGEVAQ